MVLDYEVRNRALFMQFEPTRPDRVLNLEQVEAQLERVQEVREQDEAYPFGIFLKDTDELVGRVGLNFVFRGARQSAMIGYTLDEAHNGRGLMTEAVHLTLAFGFDELHLHRIEAGIMPINIGSKRVVAKAGFTFEGVHRKSLLVQGVWEDMEQWAILEEDWHNLHK